MKIRRQLILSMLLFGLILAFIAPMLVSSNRQLDQIKGQKERAQEIISLVGELSYFANDCLLYRESQQRELWYSQFSKPSTVLANLQISGPDQQVLVDNL